MPNSVFALNVASAILSSVMVVSACSSTPDGSKNDDTVPEAGSGPGAGGDAGAGAGGDAGAGAGGDAGTGAGGDAGTGAGGDAGTAGTDDPHLAEQVVGVEGGTINAINGVSIEIPAGALTSDVTITVDEISDVAPPAGATSLGTTIQLGPEGQTFATPVSVTLPWNGGSFPVVIAHSSDRGASWTTLEEGAGANATHVSAWTSSFSWFQPVYYQGSPDAPIVLSSTDPIYPKAIGLGAAADAYLRGTGFRTDTVVTLFKDGVTTATVSPVTLTSSGLSFTVPATFTTTVGLLTIEAKNPQATVGDATATYVIEKPVLTALSPTSAYVTEAESAGSYVVTPFTVNVTASNLPDDFSLCGIRVGIPAGPTLVAGVTTTEPTRNANGFSFGVSAIPFPGIASVELLCGGVWSNGLSLTFQLAQ